MSSSNDTTGNVKIGLGMHLRYDWIHDQTYTVANFIRHPMYEERPHGVIKNDIALLDLTRNISYSDVVQPACIADQASPPFPDVCYTTGWGRLQSAGGTNCEVPCGRSKNIYNFCIFIIDVGPFYRSSSRSCTFRLRMFRKGYGKSDIT